MATRPRLAVAPVPVAEPAPATEAPLLTLEYYHDANPQTPSAYDRFLKRLARFHLDEAAYATVVLDSLTFLEFVARNNDQYRVTKSKDGRKAYAASANAVESLAFGRFAALGSHNVVLVAHIDEQKDELHGTMIRNPAAPGKLSKKLPAGFAEMYRAFATRDAASGERIWCLQTQADNLYNAATQIPAPDPCWPTYNDLWADAGTAPRWPLHCLVYGDAGSKKSTFAASFPTPMLVLMFDPFGKDAPYLRIGMPSELVVDDLGTPVRHVWEAE